MAIPLNNEQQSCFTTVYIIVFQGKKTTVNMFKSATLMP